MEFSWRECGYAVGAIHEGGNAEEILGQVAIAKNKRSQSERVYLQDAGANSSHSATIGRSQYRMG